MTRDWKSMWEQAYADAARFKRERDSIDDAFLRWRAKTLDEVERLREVAVLADSFEWPCRRHLDEGCSDCTACRMRTALEAVGLGKGGVRMS